MTKNGNKKPDVPVRLKLESFIKFNVVVGAEAAVGKFTTDDLIWVFEKILADTRKTLASRQRPINPG